MNLSTELKIRAFLAAVVQEEQRARLRAMNGVREQFSAGFSAPECHSSPSPFNDCATRYQALPEDRGRYVRWGDEIK